jgi:acyl carrier protein
MDDREILDGVTAILREVFNNESLVVYREMTAQDVSGWDSLRMVLILAELEEKFDVQISTREMDAVRNVGDLLDIVRRGTQAK